VACKNPECRNGLTPGVVIRGRGNAKLPVLGQTQTWGWVRCLACNASEEHTKAGAVFKLVKRSAEEIAQRAAMATSKAIYKPESAVAKGLGAIKSGVQQEHNQSPDNSAQLDKLINQVSKLTEQLTELMSENRELRKELKTLREPQDKPDAA
jgi:chromosome segregation ATPase